MARRSLQPKFLLSVLLGSMMLASCAAPMKGGSGSSIPNSAPAEMPAPEGVTNQKLDPASGEAPVPSQDSTQAAGDATSAPRTRPQLIRRAEISLVVDSIPQSMKQVESILRQRQGDLLGFQSEKPTEPGARQTASVQLRVPQPALDAVVAELLKLGNVQRQTITAEDVSNQLVDFEARLRNLRRSEELLLKIMDRSGSVGDVLKAAQELSRVREQIEQIDAQLTNLKNQVAFSSVNLFLEETATIVPVQSRPIGLQLQETWNRSTRSLGLFTLNLIKTGIWLLVFSPFLLLLIGFFVVAYRYLWKISLPPAKQPPQLPSDDQKLP